MFWDGAGVVPALQSFAATGRRPASVFASARYLGKALCALPDQIRLFTSITHPYAFALNVAYSGMGSAKLLHDQQKTLSLANVMTKNRAQEMASLGTTLTQLMTMALMDMRGQLLSRHLL